MSATLPSRHPLPQYSQQHGLLPSVKWQLQELLLPRLAGTAASQACCCRRRQAVACAPAVLQLQLLLHARGGGSGSSSTC